MLEREGDARAYNNLGLCYVSLGQFEHTMQYTDKARASANFIDEMQLCNIWNTLGSTFFFLGQYLVAIEVYEQALTIAQNVGGVSEGATSCGHLDNCYCALKHFSRVLALHV